jgi:hypothetical protein
MSNEGQTALDNSQKTRALTREIALQVRMAGVPEMDILVGIISGLHDMATAYLGDEVQAIEWNRNMVDLIERGLLRGNSGVQ